ncbi:2-amino-4-hydroxy-6-hydroxymethyldihydropteridine diphosphokinase [Demequina sp. NBRC 110056]|uniref:2-amino-4-hydroxy-6- hydroxymethyldihydropteridine diphosphokinase n=1 Tax=Demequina sp. NBRC 110056 TaxID=1570345 RepID=UPI000A0167C4|nr:2-amino-4-hydroxy-6-hydroxymethyldihydropteridine diphosphokinase [Demequina sp. NBRC 110056]
MTVHMRPYVKDGIELDQIAVEGIRVTGFHGVNANEREGGQLFYADVVAHVSTRAAGDGDDLTKTVNYSDLADRAAEVLAGSPFKLIEAVAAHIARELLEFDGVHCVDVTVHKPQAPLHVEFKDVTVTIRRDTKSGGLWADKRIGSSAGFPDDPNSPEGSHPPRDLMDVRPAQPVRALIAMGGNLGEVEPTFREALNEIHRVSGVTILSVAPLVRSVPEGGASQPDYLNTVVRVETALAPRELLAALHGIEMVHGRDRTVPGSARTLDLDLVQFDGVQGETEDLVLPHPRAHQRGFVVLPWVAMERDAVLEPHGSVADLARAAQFDGVTLVSAEWPRVPAPEALAHTGEQAQAPTAPVTGATPVAASPVAAASVPASAPAPVETPASAVSEPSPIPDADALAGETGPASPEQVAPDTVVPTYETEPSVPSSLPATEAPQDALSQPSVAPVTDSQPVSPYAPASQPSVAPASDVPPVSPYAAPSTPPAQESAAPARPTFQPSAPESPTPPSSAPEATAGEPATSASAPAADPNDPLAPFETPSASSAPAAPQWAPVTDTQPQGTPGVPTRTSFGVARQTPPPSSESADPTP